MTAYNRPKPDVGFNPDLPISPMDAPDFSKCDETQLRQILIRIDRERFPERVHEIEARLNAFALASSAGRSTHTKNGSDRTSAMFGSDGRAMLLWPLAIALLVTTIAAAFSFERTSAAREKWFKSQSQMEKYGVITDAVIVAKACGAKTVRYSWKWEGKELEGGGWSCNSTCPDAKLGDNVQIRFLPTSPAHVRCVPDDIVTKTGPPNYFDAMLPVILFAAVLIGPFIRLWMSREEQE